MRGISQLMGLEGRVVLVTGGAGHLGRAIADALAEAGAGVIVLDLDEERCEEVCASLRERFDVDAWPLAVDLSDEQALAAVPSFVRENCGRLDVLVHNASFRDSEAGERWAGDFEEQTAEVWRRALEVIVTAPFFLTQHLTPLLRESGHGSVIHIGSIYGILGPDHRLYEGEGSAKMGNPGAYAAGKAGLTQSARWLATTLAPDIRVNTITLGGIWRNQPESFLEQYTYRTPMGRMGTEEDVKGAALYLASDLSAYVTGQNLIVDGGWSTW